MALTQYTADTDIIETLGTNPEDRPTLTDNTFKGKFDENAANIKAFLNAMIAELLSTANGKGASQIGIEDSAGRYTATQIEAALAEIAGSGRTTETVKGLADLISTKTNQDGWVPVTDSWAYASAVTITVPSGAAAKYSKGDRIKLTQTTVKYFVVVGVADAYLTITGGSDYTLANAAISSISVSHVSTPTGFPAYFNYVPTIAVSGGTVPTYSSTIARFMINHDLADVFISLTNTTGGTAGAGTNVITILLPVFPIPSVIGTGTNYEESGTMGICFCRNAAAGDFYFQTAGLANVVGNDQSSPNRSLNFTLHYNY